MKRVITVSLRSEAHRVHWIGNSTGELLHAFQVWPVPKAVDVHPIAVPEIPEMGP
jgi:hypothetical protein